MVSKRVGSKDTLERNTGDVVKQVPMNFPINANTQLFVEKNMRNTRQEIKDIFTGRFKEDLEN